nr:MAG TPA: hypothetical protein [Caudoviricetes sp.]DAO17903.1 MAG TPA: hypothetical protein [Caudoviricetes sp.]
MIKLYHKRMLLSIIILKGVFFLWKSKIKIFY